MVEKNAKPAAKGASGSGKTNKVAATTPAAKSLGTQDSTAQLPVQQDGEIKPSSQTSTSDSASQQDPLDAGIDGGQLLTGPISPQLSIAVNANDVVTGMKYLTGNQEPLGTLAADSDVASAPVPHGAARSSFDALSTKSIPGIAVTSSRDGFWRGGRQWTKAEQKVALFELTDEQAEQIIDEPVLTVVFIDLAADAERDN